MFPLTAFKVSLSIVTAKDLLLFQDASQTEQIICSPKTLFQVAY